MSSTAMLAIRVDHVDLDGELLTPILPPDIMRWEAKTKKTMADLQRSTAMTDLAYLAWASLTRQELVRAPFDPWCEGLTGVMPVAEAVDADPTSGDN
jgi:hypothetical protein